MENNWKIATVVAGALVLLATAWGGSQYKARTESERQLSARYQERFFEAVSNVENIEVLLSKGLLTLLPSDEHREMSVTVFSDLWRQAFSAQANLSQLPLVQGPLMRTAKFLTQVGDFGYAAVRKVSNGSGLSKEDREKLSEFRREAGAINKALRGVVATAARGVMPWSKLERQSNVQLAERTTDVGSSDLATLEKHASEFPTIIYDGPFSDHIVQRKPRMPLGEEVSEGRAEEIARTFLPASMGDLVAEVTGKVDGAVPAYQISVRRAGSGDPIAQVDVSRRGGHVVWALNSRRIGDPTIDLEQAGRKAKEFLVSRGFEHIIPTYANQVGGRAIIPFAPVQNGVIIYPDLVKVTVALDTGELVGYEAMGYLMNHHDRKVTIPKITSEQAIRNVSPELSIQGTPQLALIPLETLEEVLTYEVKGTMGEEFYAVYVDAKNGQLVRILRIIDTPQGPKAV